ncbi:MAG: hypothetical protein ABI882_21265, partial [Acidobacteriota bacterium]
RKAAASRAHSKIERGGKGQTPASPKATNSIAGGNATGTRHQTLTTPKGSQPLHLDTSFGLTNSISTHAARRLVYGDELPAEP